MSSSTVAGVIVAVAWAALSLFWAVWAWRYGGGIRPKPTRTKRVLAALAMGLIWPLSVALLVKEEM